MEIVKSFMLDLWLQMIRKVLIHTDIDFSYLFGFHTIIIIIEFDN